MKTLLATIALAALSIVPCPVRAQSGGQFDLSWSTIDGGGGSSSGGQFTVCGTIGQPDAGKLTGGGFELEGGFWTGVQVLQVAGAPILKITLVGSTAILSWPLNASGFTLEETTALGSGLWTSTPQSIVDTASEHTVTVPVLGTLKLFRLKQSQVP